MLSEQQLGIKRWHKKLKRKHWLERRMKCHGNYTHCKREHPSMPHVEVSEPETMSWWRRLWEKFKKLLKQAEPTTA